MKIANDIYWQKINEIQSRLPVKLKIAGSGQSDLSAETLQNSTVDPMDFQTLLNQKLDADKAAEAADSLAGNPNVWGSADYINSVAESAAEKYGVDPCLVKGVIKAESNYNPFAESSAGAMGIMQLMPGTAKNMEVSDPYDIEQNINGGVKYLRQLIDKYSGNISLALAAYNAGPGTVTKYNGIIPPGGSLQGYIDKVLSYASDFR